MLPWSITLKGGLVLLGRETTGTYTKIMPGFAPKAKTSFVFGFGSVDILVTAGDVEKTATATVDWAIFPERAVNNPLFFFFSFFLFLKFIY